MKMQLYWMALKDFRVEQIQQAASDIIRERVYPSLPKPAEIIEAIQGTSETRAVEAWLEVYEALKRIGTYQSVKFSDPAIHSVIESLGGWVELGRTPEAEIKWKQREFERLYQIIEPCGGKHPEYLPGQIELGNSTHPDHIPAPVLVGGEKEQPRLIESRAVSA